MEEPTSLVDVLTGDRFAVGTILQSASVNMAEALGYTPLDFLFVDRQHGSPVYEELEHIVRATDLNDLPVLVRTPADAPETITSVLDLGARGIMLPQIDHPDQVRAAHRRVRYSDGRSLGTSSRATGFGQMDREAYIRYVNEELALVPMVETPGALERVDDLAALEQTTALVVGPGDLSFSLGTSPGTDEFEDALDAVYRAGERNDCPVGIFVGSEVELDRAAERAAFAVFSSDVDVAVSHFEDVLG